ncbi:glycoside hydrolase family 10 protein [Pararhodonellum marinum]|uniref:glycoside hydrolase family 10 protein n=1 Tax=Pararhodonellum marinum TaxID=2755358 RepID=UPI00188EBB12|nr:family 10 glycosylhydrolase [Pararhodonellum marinum]
MHRYFYLFLFLILISSCTGSKKVLDTSIHPPKKEFRGVWIATVVNIDWPLSGEDPFEKQQNDFLHLLDHYQSLHFNAVFVQVRTTGDAFYPSRYAPWSKYLTGKQGKAPDSTVNPLTWMIEEAHKRGLEFHAWLNPYRATFDLKTEKLSPMHDFYLHPDWMIKYGPKYYYNPGLPEVKAHLLNIIAELIEEYDLDGIHFDDYFYPYKIQGENFKDFETYALYAADGQSIDDWRRQNVNALISDIHRLIKTNKPHVQFGISPFGVWRNASVDPRGSDTRAGQTNYDDLYADPIAWMQNGWIDYLIPQLYWSLDHPLASYRKLVKWWSENAYNTPIFIGNGPYKVRSDADTAWHNVEEIPKQIDLARNTDHINGNVFFSAKSLLGTNQDLANLIKEKSYAYPALWPEYPGSATNLAPLPEIRTMYKLEDKIEIHFMSPFPESYKSLVVYMYPQKRGLNIMDPSQIQQILLLPNSANIQKIQIPYTGNVYLTITAQNQKGKEFKLRDFRIKGRQPKLIYMK